MPLELQVFFPNPPLPRAREKTSPFSSQRNHSQFFRVALVWRQGRREETSGCGQAWGGAEARLSLGRPGLPAADMSAPPEPPPPGQLGTSWAHRPRCRPQPLRGKLTRGDGGSVPFPKALPPALPVTPGSRSPHPLLPGTTLPPPSPSCRPSPRELRRPQEIWGWRGRGGAGGRGREATAAGKYAFFILSAKKGKSCLLPVPCFCSRRRGTAGP